MNGPTEKQLIFLRNLANDRPNKIAELPPNWILRMKEALNGKLTGKETGNAIEFLKGIPADVEHAPPTPGYYRLRGDVFLVKMNKEGTRPFAMRVTEGDTVLPKAVYVAGAIFQIARTPDRLTDDEVRAFAQPVKVKV
jgi:hypothetical protein